MARTAWPCATACGLVVLATLGCGGKKPTLDEVVTACGELPGARQSQHSGLRAALRDVESSGGLPRELRRPPVIPDNNAAVVLLRDFPSSDEQQQLADELQSLLDQLAELPLADWYTKAAPLVRDQSRLLETADRASQATACNYLLDFGRGYFSDMHFIDATAVACRLQLASAALATRDDDLGPAVAQFARAWQWSDWLGNEQVLEARLQAVQLRSHAYAVLQLIATDQRTTADHLRALARPLSSSLNKWPSDAAMLVGERALNMHAYEMIRQELIEMILTPDERRLLREEDQLDRFRNVEDPDAIDDDEARYLEYMAQVIAVAEQPYHERTTQLRELDRQLAVSNARAYPWLANRVFAAGLTQSQAELARSHALALGWQLALRTAAGETPTTMPVSPLNGQPLVVETVADHVVVRMDDRRVVEPRVRVPMPATVAIP